ncbi:hypothetical protein C1H46_023034 [Malus baccata]|uniref:Uncharacterized protein n=1 Tax=Malus baccata TaxID=106549 RepID=A0A540LXY8_MALBA|nr:hypothetical protein C1H46_023034 [Malus baccata]
MRSSRISMRTSLRRSTKLCVLKHASLLPLWISTIIWVPHNMEGHLPSTKVSLMRSELIIKTLINMRLLSTQLLRHEAREVEEDTSLQKGWKDRKQFIVTAETS